MARDCVRGVGESAVRRGCDSERIRGCYVCATICRLGPRRRNRMAAWRHGRCRTVRRYGQRTARWCRAAQQATMRRRALRDRVEPRPPFGGITIAGWTSSGLSGMGSEVEACAVNAGVACDCDTAEKGTICGAVSGDAEGIKPSKPGEVDISMEVKYEPW